MALHGSVGSDVIQRTCAGHAMTTYASTCPRQCLEMRGLVSEYRRVTNDGIC